MFKNHKDFNLSLERDLPKASLKDIQNREVCGFVGSALSALIKRYKKLMIVHEKDEKWDELNYSNKELLELKKIIQSSSVLVSTRNEISTQGCIERYKIHENMLQHL